MTEVIYKNRIVYSNHFMRINKGYTSGSELLNQVSKVWKYGKLDRELGIFMRSSFGTHGQKQIIKINERDWE